LGTSKVLGTAVIVFCIVYAALGVDLRRYEHGGWRRVLIGLLFVIGGLFVVGVYALLSVGARIEALEITCSMYHDGPFDAWWERNAWRYPDISKEEFRSFPFRDGLTARDAALERRNASGIAVGDVLVFNSSTVHGLVAHRVVRTWNASIPGLNETQGRFSTVGDNALAQMPYEREIHEAQVIGGKRCTVPTLTGHKGILA
jgi:hypothetical protein